MHHASCIMTTINYKNIQQIYEFFINYFYYLLWILYRYSMLYCTLALYALNLCIFSYFFHTRTHTCHTRIIYIYIYIYIIHVQYDTQKSLLNMVLYLYCS